MVFASVEIVPKEGLIVLLRLSSMTLVRLFWVSMLLAVCIELAVAFSLFSVFDIGLDMVYKVKFVCNICKVLALSNYAILLLRFHDDKL